MPLPSVTLTILDLPELLAIVEECLAAVPEWDRPQLQQRLNAIIAHAKQHTMAR